MLGGSYLEVGDERCTHMVVEENSVKELPSFPSRKLFAVKQEVGLRFSKKHLKNTVIRNILTFQLHPLNGSYPNVTTALSLHCTSCCRYLFLSGVVSDCFCISKQWFWGSIQMDARAGESMYLYEKVTSFISVLLLLVPCYLGYELYFLGGKSINVQNLCDIWSGKPSYNNNNHRIENRLNRCTQC